MTKLQSHIVSCQVCVVRPKISYISSRQAGTQEIIHTDDEDWNFSKRKKRPTDERSALG